MYFSLTTDSKLPGAISIAPGYSLLPSEPLHLATPDKALSIARALQIAITKSAPVVTTQSDAFLVGIDAERFGQSDSGFINLVTANKDVKSTVIASRLAPEPLGPFGAYIIELTQEFMMERFALPNIITQPILVEGLNLSHPLVSESVQVKFSDHVHSISRLTELGELAVGVLAQESAPNVFTSQRMTDLIKRNGISGIYPEHLTIGDQKLGELLTDGTFNDHAMDILLRIEELAEQNRNEFYASTSKSSVYWGQKKVGETYRKPGSFDIQFYGNGLQRLLANSHTSNTDTSTPAFILNWQPDEVASDPRFLEKAFSNGIYGLGNMAVLPDRKGPRMPDIQGVSIGDAIEGDLIFNGAILNIMRPSLAANNEMPEPGDVIHQQFEPDKDELTLSGAQLKTAAYVSCTNGQYRIVKAGLKDQTTHLVKIPRDSVSFRASFGALEWLSMRLAKEGGQDIPEFAMIDFNRASKKYVREEYAPALENEAGDINLTTLDLKRSIMTAGSSLGQGRMANINLKDEAERLAGDVLEPPGFIIERFDLPSNESERIIGVDFATLMGINPSQKFKMTFEDAAMTLRQHSTNFEKDASALLSRIMSSWMLVDSDLHMKNLSVLVTQTDNKQKPLDVRLSPSYDIVSVAGINQVAHENMVTMGGKRNPTLSDFVDFGVEHLDMHEAEVRDMAHRMAMGIHQEIESIRGTSIEQGYKKAEWPSIVSKHRSVAHTLNQTLDSIEANLAFKGVLPREVAELVRANIQQGNPSAFATMQALNAQQDRDEPSSSFETAPFSI